MPLWLGQVKGARLTGVVSNMARTSEQGLWRIENSRDIVSDSVYHHREVVSVLSEPINTCTGKPLCLFCPHYREQTNTEHSHAALGFSRLTMTAVQRLR